MRVAGSVVWNWLFLVVLRVRNFFHFFPTFFWTRIFFFLKSGEILPLTKVPRGFLIVILRAVEIANSGDSLGR